MLPLLTELSIANPSSQPRRRVAGVVLMGLLGGGCGRCWPLVSISLLQPTNIFSYCHVTAVL